ncbi:MULTISPECIES: hypothetical protein [Janibacter]|uniref:Uncharacterized protein n=1 Tax=Janibacter indicus TaxID=857417 RepID=A0A1W2DL09_9MICO|nr:MULTISPECIES: hypothetical protein [Janibacter]QNF94172.1 hypothetical protein H7A72_15970 [Janibacter sp. YB324]SMC97686.1 hypothetical protein SAMN06296429_1271 [Janibacter indicus]
MSFPDDPWYLTQRANDAEELTRAHNQRRENSSGKTLIDGIYHPHLVDGPGTSPIEAGTGALGQTYLTAIAGFLTYVSMPRLDLAYERSGPLAPPKFEAYGEDFDWSGAHFPSEPDWPKWGRNLGSGRVAIRDFRLAVDPGDSAPKDASEAVQAAIGDWWRLAKVWIEILTSQDLEGADRFHWSTGSLHLLYRDRLGGAWTTELRRSSLRQSWRPSMGFGASGSLSSAFHAAGCGHAPPLEWQLLREALRAFEIGQYRRVLIEAGIAAEVALTEYLTRVRRMPKAGKPTLGTLVTEEEAAGDSSILPARFRESVLTARNQVIHHRLFPTDDDAVAAFQLTVDLLERASPRDRLAEPYGLTVREDPPFDSRVQTGR